MNFLKIIFNFYINASIHVALAVYSLVRITEFYFSLPYNEPLDYFIFYGTITGYNFVKFAGVAKLHHKSLTKNLKVVQVFSFFCFILMCYYGAQISVKTLLYALPLVLLTFLYAVPFLSGFQKNLRTISYLKIVIVAVVWAGFTVLLPVLDAGKEVSIIIILSLFQRFLIVVVLILPFDIRDVKYDAIFLQTIPKKIGLKLTKRLGFLIMIFTLVIEFLVSSDAQIKNVFLGFSFFVILLLMRAKVEQSKFYSSFWVESLPIFWVLFLLGIHNFNS